MLFVLIWPYVKLHVEEFFVEADEAYRRLGIYGGDDGLTADVVVEVYKNAARMIGQDLTAEPITRGSFGVKFLARMYSPHVWDGDDVTCCDIPRQLGKLHVTVKMSLNVTAKEKLLEKVRCYLLSDSNTPIIGDFCRRVAELHGTKIVANEKTAVLVSWLSHCDLDKQYKNTNATWMNEYVVDSLPNFNYFAFMVWLKTCKTVEDLMKPPQFMEKPEAETKYPVVVDGDIVLPSAPPPPTSPEAKNEAKVPEIKTKEVQKEKEKPKVKPKPEFKSKDFKSRIPINDYKNREKSKISEEEKEKRDLAFKEKQEGFERYKAKLVAAGTWKDLPVRPRRTAA